MIGRALDWFGGFGIVKPLIALVLVLFAAASLFYYQADAAKARAERYRAENAALQASLNSELEKRKSLATQVMVTSERLAAEQRSSDELQARFLQEQEANADLDAELENKANQIRLMERAAGNEIRTFDTRGIR